MDKKKTRQEIKIDLETLLTHHTTMKAFYYFEDEGPSTGTESEDETKHADFIETIEAALEWYNLLEYHKPTTVETLAVKIREELEALLIVVDPLYYSWMRLEELPIEDLWYMLDKLRVPASPDPGDLTETIERYHNSVKTWLPDTHIAHKLMVAFDKHTDAYYQENFQDFEAAIQFVLDQEKENKSDEA